MKTTVAVSSVLLAVLLVLTGCKGGSLEPELFGTINGRVLDANTNQPLNGVSITTSPPSSAILTDNNGGFQIANIPTGNYTITATRPGYRPETKTVAVTDNRTVEAAILLRPETTAAPSTRSMSVDLLSWQNRPQGDSTIVQAEFRVRNTGTEVIPAYEVYFRIETEDVNFYQEFVGGELRPNQSDIRTFSRPIFERQATGVVVDGFWFEGQEPPGDD